MNFCLLSENDARALLAFEKINKEWFEQFIDAREDSFYSLSAVEMHIKAFLSAYNKRKMYPGIIKDNNSKVVGRANLRVLNP